MAANISDIADIIQVAGGNKAIAVALDKNATIDLMKSEGWKWALVLFLVITLSVFLGSKLSRV